MRFFADFIVFLFLTSMFIVVQAFWREFEVVSFANSNAGLLKTDLKVSRLNKTTFALKGTAEATADFNDDYNCELKLYYSATGNNQFVLLPYKIARDLCCALLDSYYYKKQEDYLTEMSNLPRRNGSVPLCFSFHKGVYEFKGYTFDSSDLWKFIETGYYKAETLITEKNTDVVSSTFSAICRLY